MSPVGAGGAGRHRSRTKRTTLIVVAIATMAAALAAAMPSAARDSHPHDARATERRASTAAAVQDTGRPAITLLYQNFPNPFPTVESRTTCIWFDLNRPGAVSLTVHDVRGNLVRRLLPRGSGSQLVPAGRYGRASPSSGTGCDPNLVWDGRADDGTVVPRGVYLIRLRAGGVESIKKALFQGS